MRIPMGNFGQLGPAPVQRTRISGEGMDAPLRAAQNLAQTGMAAADNVMTQQLRQDAQKRQEEEALTRAKAGNALLDREIQIKTLAEELSGKLQRGEMPYEMAEQSYNSALQMIDVPKLTMDPVTAENFQKGAKRVEFAGLTTIRGAVEVAKRGEMRSQADQALDALAKLSGMPGADVGRVNAQADALDAIGQAAYGAEWGKKKQDFRDGNWYNSLNQRAMTVRDDLKGITELQTAIASGEFADKLDSDRRNTLVAKLDGYRASLLQRQEVAAARAERLAEKRMRDAQAEFQTVQALTDKGTVLAPDYIDRALEVTAGTPYQKGVIELARQAQETGGLAAQPIAAQESTLRQVDSLIATRGRTPELDKRREQIVKVLDASKADLKEDGLRAGFERGVVTQIAPLDVSSVEGLAASLGARLEQAETVSQWAGTPVSPLDARESDLLRNLLEAMPAKAKSQAVALLSQTLGPKASIALAAQLDERDRPLALAFASGNQGTTSGRYTSELILRGAQAIKDGAVMKDDKKVTGWKATIAAEIDGVFENEQFANAAKEAAYLIAAGVAQENGGTVSTSDIERAVRLAVGGSIVERNGQRLPIPAGMDTGDFDERLRAINPATITAQAPSGKVIAGGIEMPAEDFAKAIPGQQLFYMGPHRYAVLVRGRPVLNTEGAPVIVEVR